MNNAYAIFSFDKHIHNLKKIEITKGPGSAIYGTDAMGGVINIITEDLNDAPTISTSYRASSFGGTPKQISNDPVNSIFKSSINIPFNNFNFSTDLTYQHFLKGHQFYPGGEQSLFLVGRCLFVKVIEENAVCLLIG